MAKRMTILRIWYGRNVVDCQMFQEQCLLVKKWNKWASLLIKGTFVLGDNTKFNNFNNRKFKNIFFSVHSKSNRRPKCITDSFLF